MRLHHQDRAVARFRVFPALLLVGLFLLSGCETLSSLQKKPQPAKILQYTQICGNAPCVQFIFTLFSDGASTYQGKAYTPLMGIYARNLSASEQESLDAALKAANLWASQETFPAVSAYYPISEITIFEGQHSKRILGQEFPQEIRSLETMLQSLANPGLPNWRLVAEHTYDIPAGVYTNVLKVQLQPIVNYDFWAGKYFDASLERLEMLQQASNFWLVRFDPSRVPPNLLKERMDNDPDVLKTEYVPIPKKR